MMADKFLETLRQEMRSSPTAMAWHQFWLALQDLSKDSSDKPPPPFILAASGESNASKLSRLAGQLLWAQKHDCLPAALRLLAAIPADQWNWGNKESWEQNSYWGENYTFGWTSDPKPKLAKIESVRLVGLLRANWPNIAGQEFAEKSSPFRFTGAKGRRLVCRVRRGSQPPKGSAFTALRASINIAIVPHMVDHVDFAPGPGGY